MDFPEVWNSREWEVVEREKELWCDASNGVQAWLGIQSLYRNLKKPNEIVREINIYRRGAIGRIWYHLVNDRLMIIASQIVKDSQWVTGLPGAGIKVVAIKVTNKYLGVRLELETESNKPPVTRNIFRDHKRTS